MSTMGAAWEWRLFVEEPDLLPSFPRAGTPQDRSEFDVYLLVPESVHNVKLRDGDLEIKRLLRAEPSGFQLWSDKVVFPFPLAPAQAVEVGSLLGTEPPGPDVRMPADLLRSVRRSRPDLRTVPLWKHRTRWTLPDGCRVEQALLIFPSGSRCWSLCADSYDPQPLRSFVSRLMLPEGALVADYIDLLLAATGRGEGESIPWVSCLHLSRPF
jgi:hypothetical protein